MSVSLRIILAEENVVHCAQQRWTWATVVPWRHWDGGPSDLCSKRSERRTSFGASPGQVLSGWEGAEWTSL